MSGRCPKADPSRFAAPRPEVKPALPAQPPPGWAPWVTPPQDLARRGRWKGSTLNTVVAAIAARDAEHLAVLAAIAALPPAEREKKLIAFVAFLRGSAC